jgi:hypothetical protein
MLVAVTLAAVPAGIAVAQSDGLKVTGGGQVVASDQTTGPGDTIAFNAQQTGDFDMDTAPAKGQLQVIQRDPAGGGQPQVKFHGTVTCIRTITVDNGMPGPSSDDETYVRFGGFQRAGTTPFTVDVQDNGEGSNATEDDMIYFRTRGSTDDPCDDSDPATQLRNSTLARGNVQQH